MSPLRVLISGASVAGPALAYWLVRAGCEVTIVERAPFLRTAGQGIDVRDAARDVVRKMKIFETLRDRSSKEEGIHVVNANNKPLANFAVDLESGDGNGPTCDIEILRGELAKVLVEITEKDVRYVFDDYIETLEEHGDQVSVGFKKGKTESYDLVVAADGMGSRTRGIAFSKDDVDFRSLNSYVSYFSIPPTEADSMWARVHWTTGGRCMLMRPDNIGRTRAFLTLTAYDGKDDRLPQMERALKQGVEAQKEINQKMFQGADWETARMLEGMHESDDFYMQQVAQVRMKRWSNGRVVVLGDAGYAPSPFAGGGTTLAFIGAYVLAGEITKSPNDVLTALKAYEGVFRPYVESVQNLPPGIPWIVNPQSKLGLRIFEAAVRAVDFVKSSWVATAVTKIAGLFSSAENDFRLPEYPAFEISEKLP